VKGWEAVARKKKKHSNITELQNYFLPFNLNRCNSHLTRVLHLCSKLEKLEYKEMEQISTRNSLTKTM
jgi:hypothetical protein